jgi:YaiO family outer membrane protein
MRFIIIILYITVLFSLIYGQSENETPTQISVLKSESKLEIEKKDTSESKKIVGEEASDATEKIETKKKSQEKPKTEIQITTNYEFLSKNLGTWKSATINFRHDFSRRKVLYGFYQKAYRGSRGSDTVTLGYYQPLTKKHTLLLEMSTSPSSQFLPKWTGFAQLETKINPTTFINTGYRHTVFKEATVHIANVGVEKYRNSFRFVYNASIAGSKGSGASFSNRFQVDKYYGKHASFIGGEVSLGKEIQSIFTASSVLKSNVQSVGFGGKHWINSRFGINWKASFTRQGEFYSRGGTSFGTIFRF